jgi:CMP-N-acetylneuraminic acid synthetase
VLENEEIEAAQDTNLNRSLVLQDKSKQITEDAKKQWTMVVYRRQQRVAPDRYIAAIDQHISFD